MAYIVLDSPVRMSKEDIYVTYRDKWVFMVNIESDGEYSPWTFAMPVVVADVPFEGNHTGIYKILHDKYGQNSMDISLGSDELHIFGFSEIVLHE